MYFTPSAVYLTGDGQEITGRDSILSYLNESVDGFDRLFDSRAAVFHNLIDTSDAITVPWTFTYTKAGAPNLVTSGTEIAKFEDHGICQLQSVFDKGVLERSHEWFENYGKQLQ